MYKVQKKLSADKMYYEDIECEELFTVSVNAHNHSGSFIGRDLDVILGGYVAKWLLKKQELI